MVGFAASQSFAESSKLVARNGTESIPKIAFSFWWALRRRSPIGAWPVCTARLMSLPLNSEPPPWTVMVISPPVAEPTQRAKALPVSVW
jgi:hypothetical protein